MTERADEGGPMSPKEEEIQVEIVSVEPRKMDKIPKPMTKAIAEAVVERLRDNPNSLKEALADGNDRETFITGLNELIEELEGDDKALLEGARDAL